MATTGRTGEERDEHARLSRVAAPAAALLWPVLLLTISGGLMGQELDWHRDTDPIFTVALLALGIALGSWAGQTNMSLDRNEAQAGRRLP